MTRLLLLRHGESEWNAVGRWQGHADPPLSADGERAASAAAAGIPGAVGVVSSDLQRARRTAQLLAEGLGVPLGDSYPALRERDVGEWSGLTHAEVDERWPGARLAGRTPSGWESDELLVARVLPLLEELAAAGDGELVVVSHGGVLRAVEAHLGGIQQPETADNLCGRFIEIERGRLVLAERVRLIED